MLVHLLRLAPLVLASLRDAPYDLPARFLDFARLVWAWHRVTGRAEEAWPVLIAWRAAQALAIGDADPLLAAIRDHAPPDGFVRIAPSELVRELTAGGASLPYLGGGKRIANHLREVRGSLALAGWDLTESQLGPRTVFSLARQEIPV